MIGPLKSEINVEFRRTIWSEKREIRAFAAGTTVAEIVNAFDKPLEFSGFGAVILYHPDHDGLDENGLPNGQWIECEHWHRIKPKAGTGIFISVVPKGGSPGGKSAAALIGAIALIALTAWVGAGGLGIGFLAPMLGPASLGAHVAAAAIGCGGRADLDLLGRT